MKKLILILIWSAVMYSQDRYYVNSDTKLYTTNSTSSEFLGYFGYSASIQLLSENKDGWYKVKSDNFSEGYVPSKFVSKTLNAADIIVKDKTNPILTADSFYGNNHLFVLAAGLKARALPDKTSKSIEILTAGEPVAVNYYPVNPEEWVNISGSFDKEYAKYVQRKYLGVRPNFSELLKQFDQIENSNISERNTIAERLVELAWNSEHEKLIPAYDRYYQVVKQLKDEKRVATTEMYMLLAKGMAKHKSPEEILKYLKGTHFVIKNIKFKDFGISQKELVKNFGKPKKITKISDECGIYLSDTFYYYPDLELSVDEKMNKAELVKVYFNANTKFVINANSVLDHSLSEKDFISKYAQYIETHIKTPHTYFLPIEAGNYTIEFRNGKLYSIEVFYMC